MLHHGAISRCASQMRRIWRAPDVAGYGGRLTSDPNRCSLGLLPSGSDPVGEWFVHRQPPGVISAAAAQKASRGPAVPGLDQGPFRPPTLSFAALPGQGREERSKSCSMNSTAAPASAFTLDPQLERDTVAIGDLPLARVLLMNDANFPWLILVPRQAGAVEIFDLDEAIRTQLMREIALVARRFKALIG